MSVLITLITRLAIRVVARLASALFVPLLVAAAVVGLLTITVAGLLFPFAWFATLSVFTSLARLDVAFLSFTALLLIAALLLIVLIVAALRILLSAILSLVRLLLSVVALVRLLFTSVAAILILLILWLRVELVLFRFLAIKRIFLLLSLILTLVLLLIRLLPLIAILILIPVVRITFLIHRFGNLNDIVFTLSRVGCYSATGKSAIIVSRGMEHDLVANFQHRKLIRNVQKKVAVDALHSLNGSQIHRLAKNASLVMLNLKFNL